MFKKNYQNIILIICLTMFFSIGYLNKFDDILMLIILSLVFTFGIYIAFVLSAFSSSKPIDAIIVNASYGYTDMKRGASNRYFISYLFRNKKYIKRLKYSTFSKYSVGDNINILVNSDNEVIIRNHLKYFILFDIFFILLSVLFLLFGVL